jgi:hypothetical protein
LFRAAFLFLDLNLHIHKQYRVPKGFQGLGRYFLFPGAPGLTLAISGAPGRILVGPLYRILITPLVSSNSSYTKGPKQDSKHLLLLHMAEVFNKVQYLGNVISNKSQITQYHNSHGGDRNTFEVMTSSLLS